MACLPCCCCCHASKLADGSYIPSPFTRTCFASAFGAKSIPVATGTASGKVLVVGSSKSKLTMTNGKVLDTGHNVSETLLPMLHLQHAGYTFDIATVPPPRRGHPHAARPARRAGRALLLVCPAHGAACGAFWQRDNDHSLERCNSHPVRREALL